ncbi:glutamate-5-semialdehyde dehydrogenase [Geofilum sp. OHC36d9]|uniref:glutamate-5-semialdehyde dehydrogenase n=1 Tax=Geofilum sp. OHC36d9 TaxID=3458413 RepID=UPI0040348E5B
MSATDQIKKAKDAVINMVHVDNDTNQKVLLELAHQAEANIQPLLAANQLDLAQMPQSDPRYDRLMLTEERIKAIAADLRNVATMASPINEVMEQYKTESGLFLKKIRVALGVIGVIYEARPNVTFDVFALCFRTGNVAVLKGGTDAWHSNSAITELIHNSLRKFNVSTEVMQLLPPDRSAARDLMNAVGYIDVLIPRGSQALITSVRDNAKVPVIETGAGVVHTYFDETADLETGKKIIFNAKTRRVSICNALECLIIHHSRLQDLAELMAPMIQKDVVIEADEPAFAALQNHYPEKLLTKATDASFGKEHLAYRLSVKTVNNIEEALNHIATYSTRHSEAIITTSETNKARFFKEVDAAAVYANTSTAFTDGAQFGMGAEIGISTQKLHARGPMSLKELTSYKWIIESDGLTRP